MLNLQTNKNLQMKKLIFLFLFASALNLQSQVIFQEDFDNVGGPTAGGAGTYSFPAGWTLANVDNLTASSSVSYVNEAWERREDFSFNVTDSCAFSTSYYTPAGTANDWMWTPAIGPLVSNCKLTWNAVAYDPAYRDGYEVRIMTVAPTGSTGVIGNMITSSTVLFSTAAENTTWTAREVDLSSYAGQTVYIGFRNNSIDKFLLLIDDVVVEAVVNDEIMLLAADNVSEYSQVPFYLSQDVTIPGATLKNNGLNVLHNPKLNVEITDEFGAIAYSDSITSPDSLLSGASIHLATLPFSPVSTGTYTIHYSASMNETDSNNANDTLSSVSFVVSDSTYARDKGIVVGALGIGAGNGGYLGQDYAITKPVYASSISLSVTRGYTGEPFAAVIWNMVAGVPDSIVASTDTLYYPDDSARFYTINLYGNNGMALLDSGQYAVTMVEFDSTISLSQTTDIFTTGHMWVNWPSTPLGGWGNTETFGASFAKPFVLRLNVVDPCETFMVDTSSVAASCSSCSDGEAMVSALGGVPPYSYLWSNMDTTATTTGLDAGLYTVTVTDASGCTQVADVNVSFTVGIDVPEIEVGVFPNPSNGTFTVYCNSISDGMMLEIVDIAGKIVYNEQMTQENVSLNGFASGVYTLKLRTNNEMIIKKIVVE